MHYFLFGKGVISEFSYSLDNREDTNLTLYCSIVELEYLEISCLTDAELVISLSSTSLYSVISFGILLASGVG